MRMCQSFVLVLAVAAPTLAQTPAPVPAPAQTAPAPTAAAPRAPAPGAPAQRAPRPGEVELPPIQCWWKTGTSEIRIGQQFTVTLTCGVVETSALTVVAGTNQLDPGALQLTPFEVVSGVRHDDIVAPPFRYFQYDYRLRLLSEGFFGQDVTIPTLSVTYNVQAAAGRGAQGRDQNYVLPALPLRVASLVPRTASDIREPMGQGFETIEARRARASTANVVGGLLMAFAGLLVVMAVLRVAGRVRQRRPESARPIAPATVLGACLKSLATVKADAARDGWSPALAQGALTALRVAAAVGLGRPMAQAPATAHQKVREGQILIRHGLLRPRRAVLSAAVTPHTIQRELSNGHAPSAASRAALEQLSEGLKAFGAAAYGRGSAVDTIALDSALADSTTAVKHLRARSLRPMGGIARTPPQTSLDTLAAERS